METGRCIISAILYRHLLYNNHSHNTALNGFIIMCYPKNNNYVHYFSMSLLTHPTHVSVIYKLYIGQQTITCTGTHFG